MRIVKVLLGSGKIAHAPAGGKGSILHAMSYEQTMDVRMGFRNVRMPISSGYISTAGHSLHVQQVVHHNVD